MGPFGQKNPFVFIYFQVDFSDDFWVWIWVSSTEKPSMAREVLQKSTFADIGFLMIPGSIFHDLLWPWDRFSWLLLPWRLARNLITFQGDSGVTPDPAPLRVSGQWCASGSLVTNYPGSLKSDSRDSEFETGSLKTEKRVDRIHDTLQSIPHSLVAPTRGAGGLMWPRA